MLIQLLEQMSKDEFEALTDEIKTALIEHLKWMRLVNISIVTRVPITDKAFIAEHSYLCCKFGLWMTKVLSDKMFRKSTFLKVDQLHRQFHQLAKELLDDVIENTATDTNKYVLFLDVQSEFFDLVLSIFEFSVVNKHQFDVTTKLINRRTVDTILVHEHHRVKRAGDTHCCIVMADIDNFKRFNDNYGHDVGDVALEHCATIFNNAVRRYDTVARYGGEEFLFILPDININEANLIIERVRTELQESIIYKGELKLSITASFGITQLCRNCDVKESMKRADISLYFAKKQGKNKTVSVDVFDFNDELPENFRDFDLENYTRLIEKHCRVV